MALFVRARRLCGRPPPAVRAGGFWYAPRRPNPRSVPVALRAARYNKRRSFALMSCGCMPPLACFARVCVLLFVACCGGGSRGRLGPKLALPSGDGALGPGPPREGGVPRGGVCAARRRPPPVACSVASAVRPVGLRVGGCCPRPPLVSVVVLPLAPPLVPSPFLWLGFVVVGGGLAGCGGSWRWPPPVLGAWGFWWGAPPGGGGGGGVGLVRCDPPVGRLFAVVPLLSPARGAAAATLVAFGASPAGCVPLLVVGCRRGPLRAACACSPFGRLHVCSSTVGVCMLASRPVGRLGFDM